MDELEAEIKDDSVPEEQSDSPKNEEKDLDTGELLRQTFTDPLVKAVKKLPKTGKKRKEAIYGCHLCDQKFISRGSRNRHISTHGPKPYNCEQCPLTFKTRKYLTRHVGNIHKDRRNIKCEVCGKMFRWNGTLQKHMYTHTGEKPYKCEFCDKRFSARYSAQVHMYIHTNEKPYKCAFCDYACRDNSTLRKHQARHLGLDKVYQCQICKKTMKNKTYLKTHIAEHLEINVKVHLCDICGRGFTKKPNLAKHIRIVHDKISDVATCPVCDGKYSAHNLKAHLRTHTDLRPYKCPVEGCNKTYKYKPAQKSHTLTHFPDDQYACDICDRKFTRQTRLKNHYMTVHAKRKCVECHDCGDKFYSKAYLIVHIRRKHSTLCRFECDTCGYISSNKPGLVMHLKAHVSENDLKCKICNAVVSKHIYLKSHYWKTHSIKYKTKPRKPPPQTENLPQDVKVKEEILSDAETAAEVDLLEIEKHEVEDDEENPNEIDSITQAKRIVDKKGYLPNNVLNELFTEHITQEMGGEEHFDLTLDIHAEELCKGEIIKLLGDTQHTDSKEKQIVMASKRILERIDPEALKDTVITNTKSTSYYVTKQKITKLKNQIQNLKKSTKKHKETSQDKDFNENTKEKAANNCKVNKRVKRKTKRRNGVVNKRKKETEDGVKEKKSQNGVKFQLDVHQCYVCFKLFKTKDELIKHCQVHFDVCSEKMLKKCPYCDYVTRRNLTRHVKAIHNIDLKIKPYKITDKKQCNDGSRYVMEVSNADVNEIEVIPSIKNLNKLASMKLDKVNRENIDKVISKRKLVKHGKEWMVVKETVSDAFVMPKFTENELKSAGVKDSDTHLQKLRKLHQFNKKHGVAILFPCDVCPKVCQNLSALTLHKRRHDPNKKPFKKKVWKHKLTEQELEDLEKRKNKTKAKVKCDAEPQPITTKHRCDPKLKEFYINNIRGGDIEFWQFLKIFNKMSRENVNDFDDLETRHDFGIHKTIKDKITKDNVTNDKCKEKVVKNTKVVKKKVKRLVKMSAEDFNRRKALKEKLRENIRLQKLQASRLID